MCYLFILAAIVFYLILSFEQQHSVAEHIRGYTHQQKGTDERTSGPSNEDYQGYHSQWGQDRYVANYLRTLGGPPGIYIELGANDGLTHSNTAYFEQILSRQGLCIEPTNANYKRLVVNRPTCKSVYGGVHNACPGATREFTTFDAPDSGMSGWTDTFAFGSKALAGYEKGGWTLTKEQVPCYAMSTLLDENGFKSSPIDYLSLDTEGSELLILKSFGFETLCSKDATLSCTRKPKVIQVEIRREFVFNGKETVQKKEDNRNYLAEMAVVNYLQSHGYEISREFSAPYRPKYHNVKSFDLLFVRSVDGA